MKVLHFWYFQCLYYPLLRILLNAHGPTPIFFPLWAFLNPSSHNRMFCCYHCSHVKMVFMIANVTEKTTQAILSILESCPELCTPAALVGLNINNCLFSLLSPQELPSQNAKLNSRLQYFPSLSKLFYIFWNF